MLTARTEVSTNKEIDACEDDMSPCRDRTCSQHAFSKKQSGVDPSIPLETPDRHICHHIIFLSHSHILRPILCCLTQSHISFPLLPSRHPPPSPRTPTAPHPAPSASPAPASDSSRSSTSSSHSTAPSPSSEAASESPTPYPTPRYIFSFERASASQIALS